MDKDDFIALNKYFHMASIMKDHYFTYCKNNDLTKHEPLELVTAAAYMSFWYSELYVVTEGWKELKYQDELIDSLIADEKMDLLRRFRNATFHFQKKYYDDNKIVPFVTHGKAHTWALLLHECLGIWFKKKLIEILNNE